jgi:hypothetical protein
MRVCSIGSFDGIEAPCAGVVFNGPLPGDKGTEAGQYTTCWRNTSVRNGWQALLIPQLSEAALPGSFEDYPNVNALKDATVPIKYGQFHVFISLEERHGTKPTWANAKSELQRRCTSAPHNHSATTCDLVATEMFDNPPNKLAPLNSLAPFEPGLEPSGGWVDFANEVLVANRNWMIAQERSLNSSNLMQLPVSPNAEDALNQRSSRKTDGNSEASIDLDEALDLDQSAGGKHGQNI